MKKKATKSSNSIEKLLPMLLGLALALPMSAQQHEHPAAAAPAHDMSQMKMQDMDMQHMGEHDSGNYGEQLELGFGSGTAWQAASAPEYMWMKRWRDWQLMAHGNLFITFNHQGGPRGAGKLESANWLM